ncbi:YTH domain-containing protein 1-like isoform X2 [Synchiropus splendidus]|uniref:YTH domain-containing protein 1-like isoform X2 n=1 Tax=Synchiropus splendidus TaxID=270530 RepID=UPI00237D57AE|nr:YTH domain-containing protein 1-like isoform X2 [Synchiropus splendidus]
MASDGADMHTENSEDTRKASDAQEHDYAHSKDAVDGAGLESFPAAELPEPALGAEVDCPAGPEVYATFQPQHTEDVFTETVVSELPVAAPPRRVDRRRRQPPRPEDRNCCCCRREFERHGHSFNRRAVHTFTNPETLVWIFPDAVAHEKSFVCETCAQVIRSRGHRKRCGRRSVWLRPPAKPAVKATKTKKGQRMGKKTKAAQLVSKACYKSALKMLWSTKGARKHMMDFWSKQLKEEMKALSRQSDSPFQQKVSSRQPLTSFPWTRCLNWAQEKAPLVTACLKALFPDVKALTKSSQNIWKNNFLQAALGAELRLQGCMGSALDALNTMGLCQNKDTVRLLLNRLHGLNDLENEKGQQMNKSEEQMNDAEEDDDEESEDNEEKEEEEEEEEEDDEDSDQELEEAEEDVEEEDEAEEDEEVKRTEDKKQSKERGKRAAKQAEDEDEEDAVEQKKRRVVVVRLGLLKGHSEVGRSDLSAP